MTRFLRTTILATFVSLGFAASCGGEPGPENTGSSGGTAGAGATGATGGAAGDRDSSTAGAGGSSIDGSAGTAGSSGGMGGAAGRGGAGASGTGGAAGNGGTTGSGGSAGNGGSTGTGGAAGSAGTTGTGGAAGTGGIGGSAGSGTTGGSAGSGTTGGSAGSGTTGGSAGSGGTAGAAGSGGLVDAGDASDTSTPPDSGAPNDASLDGADADGCTPISCTVSTGKYCGWIGNGCGSAIDCGGCPGNEVCGARTPGVCGAPCPLCPQVPRCESGTTSVHGKVVTGAAMDPDPVYSAFVFIPNVAQGGKLPPLASGPSCNRCRPLTESEAVVWALTAPDGTFTLNNVPAGTGIPLVVQLDRWRYETTIDVVPCVTNELNPGVARLPRTQAEGNIPLTAISTGNTDALECILRKMGVADTEFSNPTGPGRIQFYRNNGAIYDNTTPAQSALVDTSTNWDKYDQILFPCEGQQTAETAQALQNFVDYTSKGGRVITTHFSYTWLHQNGGFATAGQWQVNQTPPVDPLLAYVDTTTPKGQDFATWLELVGALLYTNPPRVSINDPRADITSVPPAEGGHAWISSTVPALVQHMTIDTPVKAPSDQLCGRVTFSDFHVANAINSGLTFPAECPTNTFTRQEKILEFMLLDLAACQWGDPPPPIPPPPPLPPDP